MKVSVITVSYNSADTIAESLQSVLNQEYENLELIVIDGGSTDGTVEIVEELGNAVSVFISEPDHGIYDAMNKGIGRATGDIIAILNSDDLYQDENVISDVVQKMNDTGADSCYSDLVYVHRNDVKKVVRTWNAGDFDPKKFLDGWMPPHPTFFLKRACYEEYGFFNTGFRTSADYEIMLRMLYKHRVSSVYLERITVRMRAGGQSNVSIWNRIQANKEDRRAWKENDLEPALFTTIKKPLSKLSQFFRR